MSLLLYKHGQMVNGALKATLYIIYYVVCIVL